MCSSSSSRMSSSRSLSAMCAGMLTAHVQQQSAQYSSWGAACKQSLGKLCVSPALNRMLCMKSRRVPAAVLYACPGPCHLQCFARHAHLCGQGCFSCSGCCIDALFQLAQLSRSAVHFLAGALGSGYNPRPQTAALVPAGFHSTALPLSPPTSSLSPPVIFHHNV